MIKEYSLTLLQKAVNKALSLDESMPQKLNALQGKVLEIVITPLNVHFFMRFEAQQLQLLLHCEQAPDTIIHSSPLGLIRLSLLPSSKVRSLFNDKIRLSGDVELGQRVKALFDEIDVDWEGHLAHFTGDVVAYQLGSFVRKGLQFKKELNESMQKNMTEYVQEELRLFPTREEINDFFDDVDNLVLDVERLQAHINQLMACYEIR